MFGNENNLLRKALALYAGEHVLSRVIGEGEKFLAPNAESVELTMLFFDVASFTSDDSVTVESLRRWQLAYANAVTQAIATAGGTFDTFIGDAGSAWWVAKNQPEHAERAVGCARALATAVANLEPQPGFPQVRLRIGVHTGRAALGNYGSSSRLRYSIIGDAVNLTARLCRLALDLRSDIAISDTTYKLLRTRSGFTESETVKSKGGDSLKIYVLKGNGHAI